MGGGGFLAGNTRISMSSYDEDEMGSCDEEAFAARIEGLRKAIMFIEEVSWDLNFISINVARCRLRQLQY